MSDIKSKVKQRYNEDSTPIAENVSNYNEGDTVEIAVAGKLFVGTITSISEFGSGPTPSAEMRVNINESRTQIPMDDKHRDTTIEHLKLKSGTLRGTASKDDKVSASIRTQGPHRETSTLLGVVGSIRKAK